MKCSVLISAFIGSENLGDEAIFKALLQQIGFGDRNITALSIGPDKSKRYGVNTRNAHNIIDIVNAIRECDVLLMGGGGIIQDQSSFLNFLYFGFQLAIARFFRKRVVLCFVGVGPIKHSLSKAILRALAPCIDYAIVRDEYSKGELLAHGVTSCRVITSHDPVLNYRRQFSLSPSPYSGRAPYVVVALRRWFLPGALIPAIVARILQRQGYFRKRYESYTQRVARDLDAFLAGNEAISLVFVSFFHPDDSLVSQDVVDKMTLRNRVIVAGNRMSEEDYFSVASGSEFVLGMRLHSLVMAATVGKPFVALSYSQKVDQFARQMGLPDFSIDVSAYETPVLQTKLDVMTHKATLYARTVSQEVNRCREENDQAFKILNDKLRDLCLRASPSANGTQDPET
jgi:polysaccharide pyruvyl transferase CsaB